MKCYSNCLILKWYLYLIHFDSCCIMLTVISCIQLNTSSRWINLNILLWTEVHILFNASIYQVFRWSFWVWLPRPSYGRWFKSIPQIGILCGLMVSGWVLVLQRVHVDDVDNVWSLACPTGLTNSSNFKQNFLFSKDATWPRCKKWERPHITFL